MAHQDGGNDESKNKGDEQEAMPPLSFPRRDRIGYEPHLVDHVEEPGLGVSLHESELKPSYQSRPKSLLRLECLNEDDEMGLGDALRDPALTSDEITSEPSQTDLSDSPPTAESSMRPQTDLSAYDSPPTVESSRRLQLPRALHGKEKQNPLFKHSFDRNHDEPNWVIDVPFEDSHVETGGMPSLDQAQSGPAPAPRRDSSSHEDMCIEMQGTSSSDQVQGGPAPQGESSPHDSTHEERNMQNAGTQSHDSTHEERNMQNAVTQSHVSTREERNRQNAGTQTESYCSYHNAYENGQRLTIMLDPWLGVLVQIVCSLVAYKSSNGSSPAEDVLFYALMGDWVLGLLFGLGAKWYNCHKMGGIALVVVVMGFLMTMALILIYKIG